MSANATVVRFESKSYHEKLFERFFLDDFLDVVLWAEGKTISAHRCVLAAGSTVFHQMLKICDKKDKMPVLVLNDMKFEHLRQMVEYLYCGKTKLNARELDEFFLAVKRYKILGLYESSNEALNDDQCSMVYEFPSDDDDEDDDDNDDGKNDHNRTGEREQNGMKQNKRKIDENESSSQFISPNSIPNTSKRACALPRQSKYGNGLQQPAEKSANNHSQSIQKNTKPSSQMAAADPNQATKDTMPSTSKATNGYVGESNDDMETQVGSDEATDGSANDTNGQYKCRAIGCGKRFATSQKLVRHRRFKCAKRKLFTCNRCHESFPLMFALVKHPCSGTMAKGLTAKKSKAKPS